MPETWWRGPVTWIVAVLALMAAADAVYLTWNSFSHSVVAGCDVVSLANCDEVLSSPWSRWLFVPVALGGALCYVGIAVLSLATGRLRDEAGRWAGTALLMLALLAAGSGLWFTFVQLVVLGTFCLYCMATHMCGLVIAGLVLWKFLSRPPEVAALSQSRVSLAAVPGAGAPRRTVGSTFSPAPSLGIAAGGAGSLLVVLIAGQWLFPPQTYEANKPQLDESIDMTVAASTPNTATENLSPDAQTHVVNRITDTDETFNSPSDDVELFGDGVDTSDGVAATVEENDEDVDGDSSSETTASAAELKEDAPALSREVQFLSGRVKIDAYKEAIIGSPEAKFVVIEMLDYTCPHCREMHKNIKRAKARYGDQLAVIVMPVPLELECNKLVGRTDPMHRGACRMARLALGVATLDPSAFSDYHNWLLNGEDPPSAVQTLQRAWALVDQSELSRLTKSDEMKQRIARYARLYSALSKQYSTSEKPFGLPVQVVGDTVLTGKYDTIDDMYKSWEEAIDIEPR